MLGVRYGTEPAGAPGDNRPNAFGVTGNRLGRLEEIAVMKKK
jgi:hypothetical protein